MPHYYTPGARTCRSVLGVLWPVKMTTDSLRICFKTGTPSSIVCSDNRLSSLDFDLRFPHQRLAVGLEIPSLDRVQFDRSSNRVVESTPLHSSTSDQRR